MDDSTIDTLNEIATSFRGPMDVREFIQYFFPNTITRNPDHPSPEQIPDPVDTNDLVASTQEYLINAIKPFAPALEFVNTSKDPDEQCTLFGTELKPDIAVYKAGYERLKGTDFSKMEIHGVFNFSTDGDPFKDEESRRNGPIYRSCASDETLIQLASYAAAQFSTQFRTSICTFFVCGRNARIIRWDRAGAIVTKSFSYHDHPGYLADFFWSYSHASPSARGEDTTVTSDLRGISSDIIAAARVGLGAESTTPLVKILVPDDTACGGRLDTFYLGLHPVYWAHSPIGRATRTFPVWDVRLSRIVILKDTWRDDLSGLEKEGDVYVKLHAAHVPHIAQFERAGDIPNHITITQRVEFNVRRESNHDEVRKARHFQCRPRQHYRLVLATVGRTLLTFANTRELINAVLCAAKAHKHAWERTQILHCNIRADNIMIDNDGNGFLIDWDRSHLMSTLNDKTRCKDIPIVNRRFMSANLLKHPTKPYEFIDDVESFFHVVAWAALRFSQCDRQEQSLRDFLFRAFGDTDGTGGRAYRSLDGYVKAGTMAVKEIQHITFASPPLNILFQDLLMRFGPLYSGQEMPKPTADWFISQLEQILQGSTLWPSNDGSVEQLPTTPEDFGEDSDEHSNSNGDTDDDST